MTTTPVIQPPMTPPMLIVSPLRLGPRPMHLECPKCKTLVVTLTREEPGMVSWISCALCVVCCCWLGCCLIPFFLPEFKDVDHTCPNCKNYLGSYKHFN